MSCALLAWTRYSGMPKLCDMTLPGYFLMAKASAELMALPELVEATTSTIFAPGAMAWAYSTSRLVSKAQPSTPWSLFLKLDDGHPSGQRMVKDGGSGMPKVLSNTARSFSIV